MFHSFIELLNSSSGKHELPFLPSDWINRAIVLQAKLLLRNRQLTIEQIAEELNFSTLPYFFPFFQARSRHNPYGVPKKYVTLWEKVAYILNELAITKPE